VLIQLDSTTQAQWPQQLHAHFNVLAATICQVDPAFRQVLDTLRQQAKPVRQLAQQGAFLQLARPSAPNVQQEQKQTQHLQPQPAARAPMVKHQLKAQQPALLAQLARIPLGGRHVPLNVTLGNMQAQAQQHAQHVTLAHLRRRQETRYAQTASKASTALKAPLHALCVQLVHTHLHLAWQHALYAQRENMYQPKVRQNAQTALEAKYRHLTVQSPAQTVWQGQLLRQDQVRALPVTQITTHSQERRPVVRAPRVALDYSKVAVGVLMLGSALRAAINQHKEQPHTPQDVIYVFIKITPNIDLSMIHLIIHKFFKQYLCTDNNFQPTC
jgi:hypothetical protein